MDAGCREFCQSEYIRIFESELLFLTKGKTTKDEHKRVAQQNAIRQAAINAFQNFPNIEPLEIWKTIYLSHIFKHSGISNVDTIDKIISADNSWKKSSGHAFEAMVTDLVNPELEQYNIKFILQKELSNQLKLGNIANEVRDISWLKEKIRGSVFDLYAVTTDTNSDKIKVFGCIQTKTSVRDRVTRDREPSKEAMEAFFWSIAIVLDASFLAMPKFIAMVNGNSDTEFKDNGWHALYAISRQESFNDRLKYCNIDFKQLIKDALSARDSWTNNRQWLNSKWYPEI